MRARLCGFGFWTPGHVDLASWVAGESSEDAIRPKGALLHSRLRRRTALLTKMSCDVMQRAAQQAEADLSTARLVLSSAWGEFETTVQLLAQLAEPNPEVSPTLFHNSVANTATGYVSIALENRVGSSAIGAGEDGLAAGLLEAMSMVEVEGGEVVVVVGDEPIPEPFEHAGGDGIGIAMCLRRLQDPPRGAMSVRLNLRHGDYAQCSARGEAIPARLAHNPSASVVPLCRAIASGESGAVPLRLGAERGWILDLEPEANT